MLLVGWPTLSGCDFLRPLQATKPSGNYPVALNLDAINPAASVVTIQKTRFPLGNTVFTVPEAIDLDADDTLYGIWIIDHHIAPEASFLWVDDEKKTENFDASTFRAVNFSYTLKHSDSRLNGKEQAIIEFYIVDRAVTGNNVVNPIIRWPEGSTRAKHTWVLQIE